MRTWFKIVGWVAGILAVVAIVLYAFVFDVWTVPTDDEMEAASILPTLEAGDVVLIMRHGSGVGRGNLLRCPDPQVAGRFVIARAIAQPGETFEMRGETVTIDGHRMPSPRACDTPEILVHDPQSNDDITLHCSVEDFGERDFWVLRSDDHPEPPTKVKVDTGWFFVSDDRHVHVDSRDFGQIDPSSCQHIVFRVMSKAGLGDSKKRFSVIW